MSGFSKASPWLGLSKFRRRQLALLQLGREQTMSKLKLLLTSALSVAVAAPAYAVPSIPLVPQASNATLVQWHRGGWGWRHGGGWGMGSMALDRIRCRRRCRGYHRRPSLSSAPRPLL